MHENHADTQPVETAYLFAVDRRSKDLWPAEQSLLELERLAETAGLRVAGASLQRLPTPNPATYMGPGKLGEVRAEMLALGARTLVLDDELKPGQQRGIEEALSEGFKVIDRTALILDIFAQHAHTREGKLQVEMAQCQYRLPRLTRLWTHLVRQSGARSGGLKGGVGLRGPGETQLESDRRQIRSRIARLRKELESVRVHRRHHRMTRKRRGYPCVSLVGYTNAGKSSLLKSLTSEDIPVEDKLFATLDPRTRRVRLPSGKEALFTDTVGFIAKLPHDLVAAFRATLEEIADSDLIIRLVDISSENADARLRAVDRILEEIGVFGGRTMTVWNKIDRLPTADFPEERGLRISARTGEGLPELLAEVERELANDFEPAAVLLPYGQGRLINAIRRHGTVESEEYTNEGIFLRAHLPPGLVQSVRAYQIDRRTAGGEP